MRYLILCLAPLTAAADPATITAIEAAPAGDAWRFSVTVAHGDTGWEDYADGWEVRLPDGTVLGTRVLAHPHVNEQPFTRSATISVPDGITDVELFVSETVGGYGAQAYPFTLPN
ncbi:MAG: hypothetical protein AAGH70_12085 [Pseudomonadota bacterium]